MEAAKKDLQKKKFQLRKMLAELSKYKARHTELITVYVPAGYQIQNIINQIAEEAGTARNIKSASTRKAVTTALEKMISHLRQYKKTPDNGLAIFTGNISEREGQLDIKSWSIEPPVPLNIKAYRCDQAFFLDPLIEQMEFKAVYGLVVMDRREADIALLKGKTIVPVWSEDSFVPGKFGVGGQSAARMARVIEGMAKDWYRKVGEAVNKIFSQEKVKGIIIGGPGPTKDELLAGNFIRTDIKKKVIATKAVGYTGDFGLKELVERSEDILSQEEVSEETVIMQKFLQLLASRPNMIAYGETKVNKALEMRAVETLLVSENLPEDMIFRYIEKAEESGAEVISISVDTKEGQQLAGLGGIAAILRYAI
jgi:peptide chain release factor subunit 1